ncbi:MAG: hypothetical protein ACRDOU_02760 [Streptosporangiaceae bacterium]
MPADYARAAALVSSRRGRHSTWRPARRRADRGRGEIVTDECQRTGNPRIWAAGDVTGSSPYAYTTAAQGSAAAANALFDAERAVDYAALSRVTFASPVAPHEGASEGE